MLLDRLWCKTCPICSIWLLSPNELLARVLHWPPGEPSDQRLLLSWQFEQLIAKSVLVCSTYNTSTSSDIFDCICANWALNEMDKSESQQNW